MTSAGVHRVTHVGLCVRDVERSIAFYRGALGFEVVGRMVAEGAATAAILSVPSCVVELVYLERDGLRLELLGYESGFRGEPEPRPMDQLGFTHLSIRTGGYDGLVRTIVEHGGQVVDGTEVRFDGGNRGVMCTDPDGARIELIERRDA